MCYGFHCLTIILVNRHIKYFLFFYVFGTETGMFIGMQKRQYLKSWKAIRPMFYNLWNEVQFDDFNEIRKSWQNSVLNVIVRNHFLVKFWTYCQTWYLKILVQLSNWPVDQIRQFKRKSNFSAVLVPVMFRKGSNLWKLLN